MATEPVVTFLYSGEVGTRRSLTFKKNEYTSLTQDWEADEVAGKNPFTGKMTRKCRGYYYTATLSFDGISNALLLTYRDLFNAGVTDIVFYPMAQNSTNFFPVDMNTNIRLEDFNGTHQNSFEIVFRSRERFLTPLDYAIQYWGTRQILFGDDGGHYPGGYPFTQWHDIYPSLNTDDDTNKDDADSNVAALIAHTSSATPHSTQCYTATEIDNLVIAKRERDQLTFAALATSIAAETWATNSGGTATTTIVPTACTLTYARFIHDGAVGRIVLNATMAITNYIGNGSASVTGTVASTAGLVSGQTITIAGASGTQQAKLNGTWPIIVVNSTSFAFVVASSVSAGTLTTGLGSTTKIGLRVASGTTIFVRCNYDGVNNNIYITTDYNGAVFWYLSDPLAGGVGHLCVVSIGIET